MKQHIERIDNLSKNYKIIQLEDHYSVSTDTYLLADFVNVSKSNKKNIVELCSGNGAISILLREKTESHITMVEIQKQLVDLSIRNVEYNKLNNITCLQGDIKKVKNDFSPSSFDIVICNPPYFPVNNMPSMKLKTNHSISRHEILCNLSDVINSIKYLLKQNGKFFLVHRSYRLADILNECKKYGLGIKRIRFVYSKKSSENSKTVLVEGSVSKVSDIKIEQPFYIYNEDNSYTEEMKKVYGIE
ncbi:tRNA1(Val) (adenine(37)-N6)-methyltransferase [Gemella sp. GH3]|uniref:tRNA1(Val) (adenine(37)-N6)-methyltransferase n=1 Tax=unclassified Gemella TaxID=2624949 RepID=UPI0015D0812B|nr:MULTISPECIES: tRNA1(Val) (adenine(37)-N6)-methyltransferase [unclassified Gemella]MBF0714457.1 tRNA1(Val) (adenine(37)-N6)-methyltransferase [Gemella sp. GH3.1]NYS51409.1 tRNA1(Val) (adenine(37)-N6)-methyltransferase [Gemella sp. GH3]